MTTDDTELKHLIKMANQIADNLGYAESDEESAEKVAAHISRFWAPSMRKLITAYVAEDGSELSARAKVAIESLA